MSTQPMSTRCLTILIVALACHCPAPSSAVESQTGRAKRLMTAENRGGATAVTPEAEAAALTLVRNELRQLQPVLDRLRTDAPAQYEKAIRDISRSAKRLESLRDRDENLHSLELELLKSRTSISLLVARLKVRDNDADRQSLQLAIEQLHTAERSRAEYEVELLEKRLQRTQEQLADAHARLLKKSADLDLRLNQAYTDYLRKAGRGADGTVTKKRSREKGDTER